jgi:hypothetical protein
MNTDRHGFYGERKIAGEAQLGSLLGEQRMMEIHRFTLPILSVFIGVHPWFN